MVRAALIALVLGCGSSSPEPTPLTPPAPAPSESHALTLEPASTKEPVDEGTIRSRFRDCGNGFIGQVLDASAMTCADVCRTFGYSRCRGRAGQASFEACKEQHELVGPCDEVWQSGWTSQCDCTNRPRP